MSYEQRDKEIVMGTYADDKQIAEEQEKLEAQNADALQNPGLGGATARQIQEMRDINSENEDQAYLTHAVGSDGVITQLLASLVDPIGLTLIVCVTLVSQRVLQKIKRHDWSNPASMANHDEGLKMSDKKSFFKGSFLDCFFTDMKRLLSFKLQWSERTTLEKAYTGVFVGMLIGLFPMPYEFYDSLRILVCVGLYFFFQAILPERESKRGWFILIIGLFILYNPVIPVHIGEQAIWTFLNAVTLYALYRARLVFDRDRGEL